MSYILTKEQALKHIADGTAKADGLVYDEQRHITMMAITRFDLQRVNHYDVGASDLRGTPDGKAAEVEAGMRGKPGRKPLPNGDAKTARVELRVRPETKAAWQAKAAAAGLTFAAWCEARLDKAK